MPGGATVLERGEGENVGYVPHLNAVSDETGGVLDEVGILQGVEGESEWLVMKEVDVGMQEHDSTMFGVMLVGEGGGRRHAFCFGQAGHADWKAVMILV